MANGEKRELETMQYDKYVNGNWYHATGYEVYLDGAWWNEYKGKDGELHYGR